MEFANGTCLEVALGGSADDVTLYDSAQVGNVESTTTKCSKTTCKLELEDDCQSSTPRSSPHSKRHRRRSLTGTYGYP